MDPEIRERLRRRGLPQTPMYEQAELRRMLQETQAQQRRVLEGVLGRGVPADQRRRVVNERMQQALADANDKLAARAPLYVNERPSRRVVAPKLVAERPMGSKRVIVPILSAYKG